MDSQQFESLNPEEQAKIFHHSSFKERAELIRHSHDPRALTRSLSHEELYLLTREMDIEDRSEIIRYATLPQLTFIADVDCWKRDRLDSDNFLEWLETLLAADEKVLLSWLLTMDYEAIIAGFQKVCEVLKPDREYALDEILGDTPYFSLDDMYYICVREENLATVRRAIELLFENSKGRYYSLLEDIIADISDQVEEDAYQNREHRMAARGFPDDETARRIYRPLTREEFESFPPKQKSAVKEPAQAPRYPVLWTGNRLFLDDVLVRISKDRTDILEGLHDELAWISNKVIACDGIDFSSEEKVRKGIERARDFVSIGLEDLSGGDPVKAHEILEQKWCEVIFRWGVTLLLKLRERVTVLTREYWEGDKMRLLNFLMPPYEIVAQGLLRPVPQCYEPSVKEGVFPLRDFRTLRDAELAGKSLTQLETVHRCARRDFPGIWKLAEEIPGHAALGTLYANFLLNGKPSLSAVAPAKVPELTAKIRERSSRESFLDAVYSTDERVDASVFWSFVFDLLEDELAGLDVSALPDPRFISTLILSAAPKKSVKKSPKK